MSNPGRQSLMLLNLSTKSVQQERDAECISQQGVNCPPKPPQRLSLRSRSVSLSPTQAKRRSEFSLLQVNPTLSPKMKKPQSYVQSNYFLPNEKCQRREMRACKITTNIDKVINYEESITYFKSPRNDKMSDYEDIWEKTPGPESPSQAPCEETISPTFSEKKFKQFLFNRFFDENHENPAREESIDSDKAGESNDVDYVESLPSYHSSPSSCSDTSSIISITTSDSSDNQNDTSEFSDPLQALEDLSEEYSNTESDNEEIECLEEESENEPIKESHCSIFDSKSSIQGNADLFQSLSDLPLSASSHDGDKINESKNSVGGILPKYH